MLGVLAPQLLAVWFAIFVPVLMYFHWFWLARALVLPVLDLSAHFDTYYPCHPGIGNLPYSWHCFYMLVKRWSLESQEDARYY